ncbi:Sec23-binding domain of Sec16-domain-containing protein [Phellopilus nigrolimitatus]|nr:Sec23-binding domain of Sec16-domain-containing protein [Phellopilus nigrolimitatus]
MSSVEAAASLFGSSDSGSDFFTAPEGANSASDSPVGASQAELFSGQDPSSLFDSIGEENEAPPFFSPEREAAVLVTPHGSEPLGVDAFPPHENETYGYTHDPQTTYGYDGENYNGYDAQGWYDEHGQWHGHEQPNVTNGQDNYAHVDSFDTYTSVANADPYANHHSNSAYTPPVVESSSAYAYNSTPSYLPPSTQPTYDPYKPAPTSEQQREITSNGTLAAYSYDPYKPTVNSQAGNTVSAAAADSSVYDPYKPVVLESRSLPAVHPSPSNTHLPGNMISQSALQSMKPPAPPYRPSSLNAYDPPIPVGKSKRSATTHSYQQNPSSSYHAYESLSPPPSTSHLISPQITSPIPPGPPPPRSPAFSQLKPFGPTPAAPQSTSYIPPSSSTVELSESSYDASSSYKYESSGTNVRGEAHAPPVSSQLNGHSSLSGIKQFESSSNDGVHRGRTGYSRESSNLGQESGTWVDYSSEHQRNHRSFGYGENGHATVQSDFWQEHHDGLPTVDRDVGNAAVRRFETVDSEGISKPDSPQLSASPKTPHLFEAQARSSSEYPPISSGSQRAISPISESNRSRPASVGNRSSSHGRTGSLSAGQAFASLDEQVSRHSEPYTVNRQEPPLANDAYVLPAGPSSYASFTYTSTPVAASSEVSYSPPPVSGPYAPSPSLLGTNDPLGRASAKVPLISFGFGGKLITCFHTPPTLDTGFDVALSSRKCTDVHIRLLHKVLPESISDVSTTAYPGPLFGDPGSPVTALVRTTTSSNARNKSKKAKVITYLNERAEEIQRGLGYLTPGSVDRRRADGKLGLVRLLRVLVEHDGQLHGSSTVESAVRAAILPRLADSEGTTGSNAFLNAPTGAALASGAFSSANSNEKPLAEYAVRPSALGTLQDFILKGEKRKAYHYALDEKLWAHAMIISSSMDKDAFKEVVNEFIRTELGVKPGAQTVVNGYESLRLAYSLYSGQSSAAVQHLFPTKSLQAGPALSLQPPTPINHMTPLSPNFPPPSLATNIPSEILSQWQEYAIMLFSGQMGTESSSALTTLGDYLLSNDWVEAAHCCYLLSPQSSPIGGVGAPSVRIVLVGSQSPHRNSAFLKDPDCFIFSEIAEFALSLHVPAKGLDAFTGFPHLQVYRLIRAMQLAEMGHVPLAKRYCEAITSAVFRPSPYLSNLFSDQLKEFFNRIIGDPELDKANSWISGKIAKPSLDGISDWLGGTLSKFVAGEVEPSSPMVGENPMLNNPAYTGAFSRYSNISSANTSRGSSPAPSFVNHGATSSAPPGRSGSAMGVRSPTNSYVPVNRSSSAMDYSKPGPRRNTPPPRVASADASTASYVQTQGISQAMENYGYVGGNIMGHTANGSASHLENNENHQQESGWWNAAYGDPNGATPTATSFFKVDAQATAPDDGSGFISLMDDHNIMTPSSSVATTFAGSKSNIAGVHDDLDDDLGLGNSFSKKEKKDSSESSVKEEPEKKNEGPKKPDIKPNPSSSNSWLGRWFGRSSSTTPGPVKANLGEETTFYYDKDLKRWVNKKSGGEDPKANAPPPPPSRAQTASPSRSMSKTGPPPHSPLPPSGRPLSAMAGSAPPKKTLSRMRSNLVPEESSSSSVPSTPTGMSLATPPPPGRPRSAAAKKSVRSRYVDVFQQENS